MPRYAYTPFAYHTPPELRGAAARVRPVVIVGAGPVGLAAAIDLALQGVECVVLDDNDVVSRGSRAICWAKRTLEIFDRLGVGEPILRKGVTWKLGRLFHGEREVWSFDLLPEAGHKAPAFVNLQQYYVEEYLVARCRDFPELIDLRFRNRVCGVAPQTDSVRVSIDTPDGVYDLEAEYLLACDGANSTVRRLLGLDFLGQGFEECFLIADVEMRAEFPPERWFWFEPPFHDGGSALLHKQPDGIYRIDLQLPEDADPDEEKKPENVIPRIERVVRGRPFDLDWVSVYRFQCRRLEHFTHGRVIFAGDSAHVVSPFGARGGNGGVQDVDNLCWKLALALRGQAGPALLASYDQERVHAADENIGHSARATRFMTPKSPLERLYRDEVLTLAEHHGFARRLVNSGRLSTPCSLAGFSLQSLDDPEMDGPMRPGAACLDAPLGEDGWLLERLGGGFVLLCFGPPAASPPDGVRVLCVSGAPLAGVETVTDRDGLIAQRYGAAPSAALGAAYLIRPDQHVAARFRRPTPGRLRKALDRATGGAP